MNTRSPATEFTVLDAADTCRVVAFVKAAHKAGHRSIRAALPASHPLIRSNKATQIRVATDAMADYCEDVTDATGTARVRRYLPVGGSMVCVQTIRGAK